MKQKELTSGVRIGLGFLSFLLGMALFLSALCVSAIAGGRVLTSTDSLRQIIGEFLDFDTDDDIAAVPQQSYGIQMLAYTTEEADASTGIADIITDVIYDSLAGQFGDALPVSREELGELVRKSTIDEYLVDKSAGLLSDFIRGDNNTRFLSEEVETLMEENQDLIEAVIGLPLSQTERQAVLEWFESNEVVEQLNDQGIVSLIPVPEEQPDPIQGLAISAYQIDRVMGIVRVALSVPALLGAIGVCVLLIGLMILCNRYRWAVGLRRSGYPLVLAGLPVFACLSVHSWGMPAEEPLYDSIRYMLTALTGIYALILAAGVAFVMSGVALAVLQKKKLTSENPENNEQEE